MKQAVDVLLRGAVDYAGLFPPAKLDLADAVAKYDRYRGGDDAWMLGTFVISLDRLEELDAALDRRGARSAWPVSVVMTTPTGTGLVSTSRVSITAFEFPPMPARTIPTRGVAFPPAVDVFFEVLPDAELDPRLDAIAACNRFAKIRTGGLREDAFPSPSSIYRFFRSCADRRVTCKTTAGLHHALTGRYPLTYDSHSATAQMYGFLNICMAAALVQTGATEDDVVAVLQESSPTAFRFGEDSAIWRGHRVSTGDLSATRRLLRSFGSCSFEEPVDDLKRMQLI